MLGTPLENSEQAVLSTIQGAMKITEKTEDKDKNDNKDDNDNEEKKEREEAEEDDDDEEKEEKEEEEEEKGKGKEEREKNSVNIRTKEIGVWRIFYQSEPWSFVPGVEIFRQFKGILKALPFAWRFSKETWSIAPGYLLLCGLIEIWDSIDGAISLWVTANLLNTVCIFCEFEEFICYMSFYVSMSLPLYLFALTLRLW